MKTKQMVTVLFACTAWIPVSSCSPKPDAPARPKVFPTFTDIVTACGMTFQHDNGFDGRNYRVVETVNGGVGLLDYDGDGLLDVFFTNARRLEAGADGPRNALYRQRSDGSFTDVAATARVNDASTSLGCAVADVNGDRRPDLYVTNLGPNRLYRNNGDGTFTDMAPEAGVAGSSMDSGSAFLDMERDGDLDLHVASYVVDDGIKYPPLVVRGVPGYWPPLNYKPAPHHLFENKGDGRFIDVSEASGIRAVEEPGRGLGVISADFNNDGNPDLYVANDMTANFMFLGDGKGRFTEVGFMNGTALGEQGNVLGSMGVDAADYDGDARLDLCVTNYQNQINNLYHATGRDIYEEMAHHAGISQGALPEVSWGTGFSDLDGDGWVDLFIANGHLNPGTHEMDESTSYAQPKKIFRNMGNGRFENVTSRCGEAARRPRVSRGAAFGDIDNDGDIDVIVVEARGGPEVLRNDGGNDNAWCLVELTGSGLNVDAIGARVSVTASGRKQIAERRSSGSYLSANDPRLHFGLGNAKKIDRIEVRWPEGRTEAYMDLPVRRLLKIAAGKRDVAAVELKMR